MTTLDLSDNTILETTNEGFLVLDPRDIRRSRDTDFLYRIAPDGDSQRVQAILFVLEAARVCDDSTCLPVTRVELDAPKKAYGRRVLEGNAWYADGAEEAWEVQIDPKTMRLHWTRHPQPAHGALTFRILIPGRADRMQAFFTGDGASLDNRRACGQSVRGHALQSSGETELLFYSLRPKNALRIEIPLGDSLRVARENNPSFVQQREVDWKHVVNPDPGNTFVWNVLWNTHPSSVNRISLDLGTVPAINSFQGTGLTPPTDASLDFGPFYSQTYLGAALCVRGGDRVGGLCDAATKTVGDTDSAALRDIVLGSEFLYLCAPATTKQVLLHVLEAFLPAGQGDAAVNHVAAQRHEDLALVLLAASRHARLVGPSSLVFTRLPLLRLFGERLLNLRREGEALPIVSETYATLHGKHVKEPYFTALAFAAIKGLAELERQAGTKVASLNCETAAFAMGMAARSPWTDGGLWNDKTDAFIDCMYFEKEDDPLVAGRARKEFSHYQVMTALWLGLIENPEDIRKAFTWLDYTFTYAAGRGGPTYPPDMQRTFFVLLDAYLRHKYDVPRAETLFQRVVDRSLDGGLPFTREPFGAMAKIAATESGSWLDNAPYFGLVLQIHYGLDYDHRGWHLNDPMPLHGYPLTRVRELRHAAASYSVTWQGTGQIRRVLLNGAALEGRLLNHTEGDHEVNVVLGT